MNLKNLLVFIWLLLVIYSCAPKQIASIGNSEPSATAKLVMNKRWLESDVLILQNPDTLERDITLQFPSYERDDILVLFSDGSYQYDEGSTRFQNDHKQVFVEGNWKITDDEKFLSLTANGSTNMYELLEVTDSTLVLKLAVVQGKKSYAYRLKFKSTD